MDNCLCNKIIVETDEPINNLSVEPDNDSERTSFYNLDDQDWIGVVNSNGALVPSTKSMVPIFNGIKDVSANFLNGKFANNANVRGISFPDLEKASGENCCMELCYQCPNISYAYFPKLKEVGYCAFWNAFCECSNLSGIDISKLEVIGESGVYGMFEGTGFEAEDFIFEELRSVGAVGCGNLFASCSLRNVSFPKLVSIGGNAFEYAFYHTGLVSISFSKINVDGITDNGSSFNDMLSGCENVTAHFTADLEDFSMNWNSFINGFGGTNTTILYDIDPCYVEINVIGSSDYSIYVYGIEKVSPFTTGKSDKEYCVVANSENVVYFGMLTGLVVDETTSFTANVSEVSQEIRFNVPSGVPFAVKYGNISIPLRTVSSGVYSFFSNGSGQEFSYEVGETQTTRASSGTFTLDGSSMSITITPDPKEWVEFVRPNLTADGTIGGDAFAVWSSGTYSTAASRQAWRAVDGNTSNSYYWYSKNETNPIYEFYNPVAIKLASLTFGWTSTSYCAKSFVLEVSNDGSSWTSLGSFNLTIAVSATADINCNTAYKYYRMTFTKQGTYLRLKELTMSATKYE